MINLQDVSKIYSISKEQKVNALSSVSVDIKKGEFLVITGRSGSGKTTLLNLAAGLTRPSSGKVFLDGTDLWQLSDKQQSNLRSQKLGFIFQFPSLLPSLNVLDNVILASVFSGNDDQELPEDRAVEMIHTVGLEDKLTSFPRQLSAGQQQRVVIARALMNKPEILLADEPTSDLDEQTETEIMDLFRKIHQQTGVTIVMVTHSSQLVSYGTRSIAMANGKIINSN